MSVSCVMFVNHVMSWLPYIAGAQSAIRTNIQCMYQIRASIPRAKACFNLDKIV